jgi:nucleotide-binding universal stress UspA family protein
MEVRRILFPLDLSEFCAAIVPQVISVAQKFGAEVHLVSAVEPLERPRDLFVSHPSFDGLDKEALERAELSLRTFEEEFFLGYRNVKRAVLRGHPGEEILKYIDSAGIDLVVMATHRRKGLEKALLGSVADEVIRKSPVPVMSINPCEGELGWRVSNIRPEEELKLRPKWQDA